MRNLLALLRRIPGAVVTGDADCMCLDITADSRMVGPGSLFVAIPGSRQDGHSYIDDAIDMGAVAVVGQRPPAEVLPIPYVTVPDARRAYAQLVHGWYDDPADGMRLYGVTGTNGKTTCTYILHQILSEAGREAALIGTTGIRFGGVWYPTTHTTPDAKTLAELFREMRRQRVDSVCMEVSSHALDQGRVDGLHWQGAMFTNLTHDHLDYHGTMENYASAKARLFAMVPPDGVVVLNDDDPWAPTMRRESRSRRTVGVGVSDDATIQIDDVRLDASGARFSLVLPPAKRGGIPHVVDFRTPLLGRFNVTNAALCATMALQEAVPEARLVDIMRHIKAPPGRMERFSLRSGATAVVDYAHTPDALQQAISVLRDVLPADGRLTVVFGCGGNRDAAKRPHMGRIAASLADAVILTSDNPRHEPPHAIIADIADGVPEELFSRVTVEIDRRRAIAAAIASAAAGDIVLIAGKGHEQEQIIGDDRLHFSDADEVRRLGT